MVNLEIGDFKSITIGQKKEKRESSRAKKSKAKMPNYADEFKKDRSAWALLAVNIITIIFAVAQRWNLVAIMLTYWSQSVIIGIFHFVRILALDKFETSDFLVNGKPVEAVAKTKYSTAFFFLAHYGIFHLVYLVFLMVALAGGMVQNTEGLAPGGIAIAAAGFFGSAILFFINHLFSFRYNLEKDKASRPNIGRLMFQPYLRIIPMHIAICTGALFFGSSAGIIIFMGLKTLADLAMHLNQHRY